jgi:phosphoribosylanthranilate isomerase
VAIKLKICGVTRPEDLAACVELGVDAIGINLWSGSRRGLSIEQARLLLREAPAGGPERVGVFVNPSEDEVRRAHGELGLDLVQVITDGPATAPSLPYMFVIRGTPAIDQVMITTPAPARFLLDAAVPGYGGAGQTTDWSWARAAVQRLSPAAPVWLAGGITPDNAAAAISAVSPAGLDVASGAEMADARRGEKDRARIAALLAACRR